MSREKPRSVKFEEGEGIQRPPVTTSCVSPTLCQSPGEEGAVLTTIPPTVFIGRFRKNVVLSIVITLTCIITDIQCRDVGYLGFVHIDPVLNRNQPKVFTATRTPVRLWSGVFSSILLPLFTFYVHQNWLILLLFYRIKTFYKFRILVHSSNYPGEDP